MNCLNQIQVIVGTYEEFLLGYRVRKSKHRCYDFSPIFSNHSNLGSIKTLAVVDHTLFSGGTDEVVRVFNLLERVEEYTFQIDNGTISNIIYHPSGYLYVCGGNGYISIYNCSDKANNKYKCTAILRGHRGQVNGIAIHNSGKLALSIGRDKSMVTWNLISAKKAHRTNFDKVPDHIIFSPCNKYYLIVFGAEIVIYKMEDAKELLSVDFNNKINCILFVRDHTFVVGNDSTYLLTYNIAQRQNLQQWVAHTNRTKSLTAVTISNKKGASTFLSASSDGYIKLWLLESFNDLPVLLGEVNTTCRITCMTCFIDTHMENTLADIDLEAFTLGVEEVDEKDFRHKKGRIDKKQKNAKKRKFINSNDGKIVKKLKSKKLKPREQATVVVREEASKISRKERIQMLQSISVRDIDRMTQMRKEKREMKQEEEEAMIEERKQNKKLEKSNNKRKLKAEIKPEYEIKEEITLDDDDNDDLVIGDSSSSDREEDNIDNEDDGLNDNNEESAEDDTGL